MMMTSQVYQYKLVLLGESAVGKSSIVLRFVRNSFNEHQESTIGAAFLTQSMNIDGATLKFEIWDTAGQERYHSLAPMYYRGAQAAIVVYDISNHVLFLLHFNDYCMQDSFVKAKTWVKELQRQASPNIVIALVGNKSDLDSNRQIQLTEAQQYADDLGLLFFEASALNGCNVKLIFESIAKKLPKTEQNLASSRSMSGVRRVELKYDVGGGSEQRFGSKCC